MDEYFSAAVFQRVFTAPSTGILSGGGVGGGHYDTDGDGVADTPAQIQAQYVKWRNRLTAILRKELGKTNVQPAFKLT